MAKYIIFDTETTGNSDEDRIIQIGAMVISSRENIEIYDELCSSDIEIKTEAMEVHNITPDMIENKPLFVETKFCKRLNELNNSKNYLIAHNIKFDLDMVGKEGFESTMKKIDTFRCSRHLFENQLYHRLQYLRYALEIYKDEKAEAKKLGITVKAHDAIGDVLITKLLLSKLVAVVRKRYPNEDIMDKLVKLTKTPVFIKIFKFGKYKGRDTKEIASEDIRYIHWMRKNLELDDDMKYTLDKLLG